MKKQYKDIDEYIKSVPENIQSTLEEIRQVIKRVVPQAEEGISYQMPVFKLNGNLVYFAAFKNHIGFFPTPSGVEHFKDEITSYKTNKGTIQFPLDKPIPFELIENIVRFRVNENLNKKPSSRQKK
jgi:uncharacterized protein YdhG (YjbR/CyaY superfamily)